MDKKIEQFCQSDLVTTNNILHIIDSIDFEIMEHHFKSAFYGKLLDKPHGIDFSDEFDLIVDRLKKKTADSFRVLLFIQGKDKDNDKELTSLVQKLVVDRFTVLMGEGYITYLDKDKTCLNAMDTKTIKFIYGLIHSLQHEETKEDANKAMKQMVESMSKVSKDIFGHNIDLTGLFNNEHSGKIDLSKILGTETKENVDVLKKDDKKDDQL